VCASDRVDI